MTIEFLHPTALQGALEELLSWSGPQAAALVATLETLQGRTLVRRNEVREERAAAELARQLTGSTRRS